MNVDAHLRLLHLFFISVICLLLSSPLFTCNSIKFNGKAFVYKAECGVCEHNFLTYSELAWLQSSLMRVFFHEPIKTFNIVRISRLNRKLHTLHVKMIERVFLQLHYLSSSIYFLITRYACNFLNTISLYVYRWNMSAYSDLFYFLLLSFPDFQFILFIHGMCYLVITCRWITR